MSFYIINMKYKIDKFQSSMHYKLIFFFFITLNAIAFGLYDYSYRLNHTSIYSLSINKKAFIIEIICNIFFSLEVIIKIFLTGAISNKNSYLRNLEGLINTFLLILKYLKLNSFH